MVYYCLTNIRLRESLYLIHLNSSAILGIVTPCCNFHHSSDSASRGHYNLSIAIQRGILHLVSTPLKNMSFVYGKDYHGLSYILWNMKAMFETTKQITIASILLYWLQHPEIPPTSHPHTSAPLALAEGCCTSGSMSPGGVVSTRHADLPWRYDKANWK